MSTTTNKKVGRPKKTTNVNNKNLPNITNQNFGMSAVAEQWQLLYKKDKSKVVEGLGYAYNNSPYIQNQRVKRVSSQPFTTNRENLEGALNNPQESEQTLRQASQSFISNYPLTKLNNLYADILTYRWYFHSKYTTTEDVKGTMYKNERKKISKWCDKLQPSRSFQNIVLDVQREGKVAYYVRDSIAEKGKEFDYVYLQQIPSDYWKVVGWNTSSKFTVSFDFTYFWQAGTSPQQFPPIFQKYYKEFQKMFPDKNTLAVDVKNLELTEEQELYYSDNKWYYWHTLPYDECFVFSQDESHPYQMPNTIGLFLQATDLKDYAFLQQELLQLPLSGVVVGTLPMVQDSGGTLAQDNYALGTDAFEFFTNMFNEVAPRGIQLFINPAKDFKFFKFDGDTVNNSEIMTKALQQFNSTANMSGLNPITDKPNISQVKSQQLLEGAYVSKMYKQFENCINQWFENKLALHYSWKFKIKGTIFNDLNTFAWVQQAITTGQNGLYPEFLSYFDMRLDDFACMQNEVVESDVYDKFQVVQSAFNQSARVSSDNINEKKNIDIVEKKNGRPNADENNIESDNTATSIENGTNTADGRETMSLKYCVECGEKLNTNAVWGCFCSNECKEENEERVGGIA